MTSDSESDSYWVRMRAVITWDWNLLFLKDNVEETPEISGGSHIINHPRSQSLEYDIIYW